MSRSFRSTSPACAARSRPAAPCAGSIGSFAGIATDERAEQLTLVPDLGQVIVGAARGASAVIGHAADLPQLVADRSHTRARSAPTPSARTRAVRGRTSSAA